MTRAAAPSFEAVGGAFYLHGEDEFRKEAAVRALVDAHLDPATRDFNFDSLRGTEVGAETLASVLATPPMMAEWRVVLLREAEGLASSKHAREVLLGTVADPPPGLALIVSCTVPKGSKAKFYQELARKAQSLEFKEITSDDVPGWLMERARDVHGVEVDPEAARALAAAMGTNLGVLAKELEKLTDFVGARGRITVGDVDAAGTKLPSQDRWKWFDLVGERLFADAGRSLPVLLAQGESCVGLVIGLTSHLMRLGVAVERGQRGLEAVLPAHQRWLARPIARQASRWTLPQVEKAVEGLLDTDRLLKASPHTKEHFVQAWLLSQRAYSEAA